ncbi:hypothetical protein J6590_043415 [Homalodisca vitripennis]|nr:hypothetical protein J6590_043415 [Homalodisca vitripennis]
MGHRKCFRDAAHNATTPPLPPITTHSRERTRPGAMRCNQICSGNRCGGQIGRVTESRRAIVRNDQAVNLPPLSRLKTEIAELRSATRWTIELRHECSREIVFYPACMTVYFREQR